MRKVEGLRHAGLVASAVAAAGGLAFWAAVTYGPQDNIRPGLESDPCAVVATIPDTLHNQTWSQLRQRTDPEGRCGILATDAALHTANPDLIGGTTGQDKFRNDPLDVPVFSYVLNSAVTQGTIPPPAPTTQS